MTSDDLKWPQMTSKNEIRKKYAYMGIILTQIQFYLIILTFWWPQMTSGDLRWPQMTPDDLRWPQMTSDDFRCLRLEMEVKVTKIY